MFTTDQALLAVRGMIVRRRNARGSTAVSCGWLAEEIKDVIVTESSVTCELTGDRKFSGTITDLNLRELAELEKFLGERVALEKRSSR